MRNQNRQKKLPVNTLPENTTLVMLKNRCKKGRRGLVRNRISCRVCSGFDLEFIETVSSDESKIGFNLLVIKGEIKDFGHLALYRCLQCNEISGYSINC